MHHQSVYLFSIITYLVSFAHASEDHGRSLIDWVTSRGGFVNDKVELRRLDPTDDSSPFGAFAGETILENESIFRIPRNCYLGLSNTSKDASDYRQKGAFEPDWVDRYAKSVCQLAHRIMEEWEVFRKTPEKSNYGPYFAYLDTQPYGQIPATYSDAGKELLRRVIGPKQTGISKTEESYRWDMIDWFDDHFIKTGCIDKDDPKAIHAVALAIQRGYDAELVPIWDMVNHDNEELNVESNSLQSEEGLHVWASETIEQGNEIFASYNYCTDCSNIGDEWGTYGIYRDFGFVEGEYQVWPFLEHGIWFTVTNEGEHNEHAEAMFYADEENGDVIYGLPDEDGLEYLVDELARLKEIDIEARSGQIPLYEDFNIQEYYWAYRTALEAGIEATLHEYHEAEHGEEEDDDDDDDDDDGDDSDDSDDEEEEDEL